MKQPTTLVDCSAVRWLLHGNAGRRANHLATTRLPNTTTLVLDLLQACFEMFEVASLRSTYPQVVLGE